MIIELDDRLRLVLRELLNRNVGEPLGQLGHGRGVNGTVLYGALHNRLLRLHRPFFVRGLRDVRYEQSNPHLHRLCASAILHAYIPFTDEFIRTPRWWGIDALSWRMPCHFCGSH